MDLLTAHKVATRQFDRRVRLIRDDQWANTTPCTEWTVRDLVNHLVYEQLWVPDLLAGKTVAEVGDAYDGDVLGADPVAAWSAASTAARDAWTAPGVRDRSVHLSYATVPADEYLWQIVVDLTVHAWDLARGIGDDDEMPNDLTGEVVAMVRQHRDELTGSGLFADPLETSACTDDLTELLALLGRARWKKFQPVAAADLLRR
jgi:uncharacterized protein (TIGR03086 family)